MIIMWLVVVTIISITALTVSLVAWSRLPRQSSAPLYPPQPYPLPSPDSLYVPGPGYNPAPTPNPPPVQWERRVLCEGSVID
jgi:hypothetical protein